MAGWIAPPEGPLSPQNPSGPSTPRKHQANRLGVPPSVARSPLTKGFRHATKNCPAHSSIRTISGRCCVKNTQPTGAPPLECASPMCQFIVANQWIYSDPLFPAQARAATFLRNSLCAICASKSTLSLRSRHSNMCDAKLAGSVCGRRRNSPPVQTDRRWRESALGSIERDQGGKFGRQALLDIGGFEHRATPVTVPCSGATDRRIAGNGPAVQSARMLV